jgi:high-affinity Fe2+/Pb2+ permease
VVLVVVVVLSWEKKTTIKKKKTGIIDVVSPSLYFSVWLEFGILLFENFSRQVLMARIFRTGMGLGTIIIIIIIIGVVKLHEQVNLTNESSSRHGFKL